MTIKQMVALLGGLAIGAVVTLAVLIVVHIPLSLRPSLHGRHRGLVRVGGHHRS